MATMTPTVISPYSPTASWNGRSCTASSVGSSYSPRSTTRMDRSSAYVAGSTVSHSRLNPKVYFSSLAWM